MAKVLEIDDPKFGVLVEWGISIKRLEARMRPCIDRWIERIDEDVEKHDGWEERSVPGFLGHNENLLELVHADWNIVNRYGTTHCAIAETLEKVIEGERLLDLEYEFLSYNPNNPAYCLGWSLVSGGWQECPWTKRMASEQMIWKEGCNTYGGDEGVIVRKSVTEDEKVFAIVATSGAVESVTLEDTAWFIKTGQLDLVRRGEQMRRVIEIAQKPRGEVFFAQITGILPHLIREHYFFEGKKSPFRADPEFLIKALGLAGQPDLT